MGKTINGRTVLVTNMSRVILAIGCFVMNNPLGADIFTPTIDYEGVSYERLLAIYKEEFAKVGFVLSGQIEDVNGVYETSTEIRFGFSNADGRYLSNALPIIIYTKGKQDGICSPCTAEVAAGGGEGFDLKLLLELEPAMISAKMQAEDQIKAKVAGIVQESSENKESSESK